MASGMAANAYAACDTATVSGACPRMTLPSAAGNANYVLDSSAVVPDVLVNNAIGSLTNNGRIGSSSYCAD